MIVSNIIGGLGNQLFQYALGRKLAIKHNTELYLNINKNHYNKRKDRNFLLDKFNTSYKLFENKNSNLKLIKENGFNYNKNIETVQNNIILNGYWQTELYFKDIKNILYSELTLKNKINYNINLDNIISIHVRRGDYLKPKINKIHGTCSLEYYHAAVSIIKKQIQNPKFIIFSDNINWCKKNLKINNSIYFDYNIPDYQQLIMMSKCKHNIIANSSFSWWAAWLNNNNNEKIIIAPKKWFNITNRNYKDIIPINWRII